jgi:hypothetical protein
MWIDPQNNPTELAGEGIEYTFGRAKWQYRKTMLSNKKGRENLQMLEALPCN